MNADRINIIPENSTHCISLGTADINIPSVVLNCMNVKKLGELNGFTIYQPK